MLFANVCEGFVSSCYWGAKGSSVLDEDNASFGIVWVLWFLLGVLCIWGVLVFPGLPVMYKSWVT